MTIKLGIEDVCAARILSEDKDFCILEVGKHDGVTFHLQQDGTTGETIGGDQFVTIVFTHGKPWEKGRSSGAA